MKKISLILTSIFIVSTSLVAVPNANAGQLSAADTSISWEDSTFYEPSSCTSYIFSYTASNKVLYAEIAITNMFNDRIGSTTVFGPNSGKSSVQVCTGKDLRGTRVVLTVRGSAVYGGVDDIVSTPITFLSRTSTPLKSPTPTPTVTVTAAPSAAPTVYISNPADQTLTDLVSSLQSQIKLLNSKLKRICNVKPKPKGC
jgi:hypothetical protein